MKLTTEPNKINRRAFVAAVASTAVALPALAQATSPQAEWVTQRKVANGPAVLPAVETSPPSSGRTASPITASQMHVGHSLMDRTIIGGSGYPDQLYVQLLKSLDLGTPDLDIDTVAGAELLYHQQNATSGWTDTADYEVITVTERADTYPFAMYNTYTGWINTFRNERQTSMDTWFSRSQTVGNGGAGCDFFYHTCWPGKEDYSGVGDTQDITPTSWRQKIGLDETEQLAIAERAEDNVAGDAKIWIIPGTRLMMQLYDDAEAGDMPDITDAADFMEDGNRWWADDIHQGPIMAMAYAYLFLYVIHGIDPRGLAYTGFDMPLEPTAAEASYIQNTVYNLVQSYPRAGVVA